MLTQNEIKEKVSLRKESFINLMQENVTNWYPIVESDDANC